MTDLDTVLEQLGAATSGTTTLLAQMPVGVLIAEAPSGRLLYANERVEAIWRRPLTPGDPGYVDAISTGVRADGRPLLASDWPLARVLDTSEPVEAEHVEYIRGDNSHGFMLCSAAPVLNAHGTMVAAVAMFNDVTAQYTAEQRVRQVAEIASRVNRAHGQDDVAAAVLEVVPAVGAYGGALLMLSTDGEWFHLLGSAGYTDSQLEAFRRYPVATPAPTREAVRRNRAVFLSRAEDWDPSYVVRPSKRSMSAAAIPLRASDQIIGVLTLSFERLHPFDEPERAFLLTVADLAAQALARAEAYDAAASANRAKDYFFATISHELRSPLTSIQGWTAILKKMEVPESMARGLASIERNAQVQAALIADLVDFAQASSGKLRLTLADADVARTVLDTLDALRPEAAHRSVHLELQMEGEVPRVRGDLNRLQQVVSNLIGNALKFTPSGGMVMVALGRRGEEVVLEVRDTGIGIDPDLLPFVFEPFRQGDARGHRGLGLGLSIVRHIVEAHGGRVIAHSAGAGQGATFTVHLPLPPAA